MIMRALAKVESCSRRYYALGSAVRPGLRRLSPNFVDTHYRWSTFHFASSSPTSSQDISFSSASVQPSLISKNLDNRPSNIPIKSRPKRTVDKGKRSTARLDAYTNDQGNLIVVILSYSPFVNMSQNDIDSSDQDFDAPPNSFAKAGQASIKSMIEHAKEDRLSSKRAAKELSDVRGSISTQYNKALWFQRFEAFRQHVLMTRYV